MSGQIGCSARERRDLVSIDHVDIYIIVQGMHSRRQLSASIVGSTGERWWEGGCCRLTGSGMRRSSFFFRGFRSFISHFCRDSSRGEDTKFLAVPHDNTYMRHIRYRTGENKEERNGEEKQGGFGKQFTDHMMTMRYSYIHGWSEPTLTAIGDIPMHPASQVLHYGMACFEGIKAFRNLTDPQQVHLFRPDIHLKRLGVSASRLQLPQISSNQLLESIKDLVRLDQDRVPHMRGQSLYVRPLLFSSSAMLGVTSPQEATMTVILSPCTDVVDQQCPMTLFVEEEHCRAWPGGTGHVKLSGNYASTIHPQKQAKDLFGADQVLYLAPSTSPGSKLSIAECGTMNVFFVFQHKECLHVVTPALTDTILPGVTRASIIDIIRGWPDMPAVRVMERTITLEEVQHAANHGSLIEMFACGTASGVQSIGSLVQKNGERLTPIHASGPITTRVRTTLLDIQHGMLNDAEYASSWLHTV